MSATKAQVIRDYIENEATEEEILFFASLTEDQLREVAQEMAANRELSDSELEAVVGGSDSSFKTDILAYAHKLKSKFATQVEESKKKAEELAEARRKAQEDEKAHSQVSADYARSLEHAEKAINFIQSL